MVRRHATTICVACIAATNVFHPFVHHFEGGTLDMILDYLNAMGAQLASNLNPTPKGK